MRLFVQLITTVCLLLGNPIHLAAQTWQDVAERLKNRELVLRPIEGRRKVYLETAGNLEAYALFEGTRLFPLRAAEPVRVVSASPKNDHIEIQLSSARLGRGRVDLYGAAPSAQQLDSWLDEIFELQTPAASFARFIANRQTKVLHVRGANHLPTVESREAHATIKGATTAGHRLCGVCFMPVPDVSDFQTEQALAMLSLQQVRASYYPTVDPARQKRVVDVGDRVLQSWPVPLKGYRYRFQLVEADELNAFAVPTGHVFVTSGLLDALETDDELSAILAHEIAHVESRHSYRIWRNLQRAQAVAGILGALSGATNTAVDDVVTAMTNFAAGVFLSGFGRDREREADLFASLYLNGAGRTDEPLLTSFRKLKFAKDAVDPLGNALGGPFATHPHIEERISKAKETKTSKFSEREIFHGLNRAGDLVATLRLDAQRVHEREYEMVATLATTAELGQKDAVNSLTLQIGNERLALTEVTAESIFPSDEVSAVFRANRDSLLSTPVTAVTLRLRNVDRWVQAAPAAK